MPGSLPTRSSDTAPNDQKTDEAATHVDHPAPRLVLYCAGDPGAKDANAFQLSAAVQARGWTVAEVRSDAGDDKTAWLRKDLLSAITMVCHRQADGIVMYQSTFDALLLDDQNWLRRRLKHFDGFLHTIPPQGEASAR